MVGEVLHPLGASKARFSIYLDKGRGSIEVFDDGVEVNAGRVLQMRNNYVVSLERGNKLPLSKVGAIVWYYDMFGNKESIAFAMNEDDFRALKKILGK